MDNKMQLDSHMEGSTLVIQIEGRLDSSNASELKDRYVEDAAKNPHDQVCLDLENLEYLSSAGLRSVLYILKAETARVDAINVNAEVHSILEMTGFTELMNVVKALREVSVENCEIIGRGALGTVYRLDDETILKLYSPLVPLALIERERERAKLAFVKGVPTAIAYEIVRSGDCKGVVFEMLHAETLSTHIRKNPDELEHWADEYAKFVRKVHETDVTDAALPNVKDNYRQMVMRSKGIDGFNEEKVTACLRLIDAVPDGHAMLHGDTHPNNVMLQDGELILIDMAELSYGNSLFDFGGIFLGLKYAGSVDPNLTAQFVGLSYSQALYMWDRLFAVYFGADEAEVKRRQDIVEGFGLLKVAMLPQLAPDLPQQLKDYCKMATEAHFFPHIDAIIESVKQW